MPQADTQSSSPSPHEQLMGAFVGLLQGRCVIAAAELGIADALAAGPLPVEAIAAQTGANADSLFRLMRALESIGIFTQVSPRVFANTPVSEGLRKDVPGSSWAFLQVMAPGWGYWDGLSEMLPSIRTGTTALHEARGYDSWEFYRRNPEQWPVFNEAMRSLTAPMTPDVTAAYDWGQFPVIADIAGGIGTQLVDILDAHPGSRGVVFDLPEVVSTAIDHDRVARVAGDFFREVPVEADAYILRNIIHDWDDAKATAILKTLRKATRPTARVMLLEWVLPDSSDFHLGKWTDMVMMTGVGGRERTRADFEKLFSASGFALEDVIRTASMFGIVVGRPA